MTPEPRSSPYWLLLPIIWMTGLYALSSLRPGSIPVGASWPHFDKVAHAVVYLGLVVSFLPWGCGRSRVRDWLPFAVGAALGFAVADEAHQYLVPGREPDWGDLLADGLGVFLGAWLSAADWSRRIVCHILK